MRSGQRRGCPHELLHAFLGGGWSVDSDETDIVIQCSKGRLVLCRGSYCEVVASKVT